MVTCFYSNHVLTLFGSMVTGKYIQLVGVDQENWQRF